MADEDDLNAIMNDEGEVDASKGDLETGAAEVEAETETEVEAEEATTDAEVKGDDATAKEAGTEGTPTSDEAGSTHVPTAALIDERHKRQEAERELAALKEERDAVPRPDPSEDPEGAYNHLENRVASSLAETRIALARDMMMHSHDDYAEKEATFLKMAESNPQMVDDMLAADNPARFAYEMAGKQQDYDALKDVDGYKAKLREELKAEVKAELEAETTVNAAGDARRAKAAGVPSLASVAGATIGEPAVEESLEDVMGR